MIFLIAFSIKHNANVINNNFQQGVELWFRSYQSDCEVILVFV